MAETAGKFRHLFFFIFPGDRIDTETWSYIHPSYFNQGKKGVL